MGRGESEFTVVGDNKILTVSYGTFSCTLEGFEDPFSTMKNIAEYFRDLAAGDRFFGAEPPQPDPEMLQSIAEQTIKARVNAQLSDNNLVLSQEGASGSAAPAAPVVAAAAVAPQVMPMAQPAAPGVETVAEKLQRIRAVVSRETAQDAFFSEDQHVEEFTAETTAPFGSFEDDPDNAPVADATVADPVTEETEVEAPVADVDEVEDTTDFVSDTPSLEEEATSEVAVEDTFEAEEDEAPVAALLDENFEEETTSEMPEIDLAALTADAAPVEDIEAPTTEDSVEDEPEAPVAEQIVADEVVDEVETPSEEVDFADEDAALESALASITSEETTAEELSDATEEEVDVVDDAVAREDAAEAAVDSVLGRIDDEDGEKEEVAPRRRIVVQKITREDLRAARKDNAETEDQSDVTGETLADDMLPPEEEAELQRELAALQGDITEEVVAEELPVEEETLELDDDLSDALSSMVSEDASVYEAEEKEAARATRLARREAIVEEDVSDVERLMDATTSRIDHDESSNRRASIAHLKAAVAATKADSSMVEAAQEQEARERDQYAEDLARVVRPERAQPRPDRAKTDRPAPLVLVSELRIDKDEEENADQTDAAAQAVADEGPVRPRRVSRAALDEADEPVSIEDENLFNDPDQSSFAEYAAAANALELPDLLEAAAAYYTYVESTEQFTRPMLMRKIASISARDGFSREAGLRSFGTLLREGKLVKGTDGKFVIAKSSRFTPEARYAGE